MLTQAPAQSVVPVGQAHWPATHTKPPAHAIPHPPHSDGSVCVSTQLWSHDVSPAAQVSVHEPLEHDSPPAHWLPQVPQLFGSVLVFTQPPSHGVSPGVQPQWPLRQVVPFAHALPQAPQWIASANRSTHAPAHDVNPAPHAAAQAPALHTGVAPEHA
jgi:hypothetical protein